MNQKSTHTLLSIGALIVSVIAILVAVEAYNRTGRNITNEAGSIFGEAQQNIEETINTLDIQRKLIQIESDIQNNDVTDETRNLLSEIRQEARELNIDPSVEFQLNQLEQQLRNGSAEALATIENILAALRKEIQSDEN